MNDNFIINSKNDVLDGKALSNSTIQKLFNVKNIHLKELSDAANEITRYFQGKKVDVEHLANIKKNCTNTAMPPSLSASWIYRISTQNFNT